MNKERLLRLASRLDKVAPAHFNLGVWYIHPELEDKPDDKRHILDLIEKTEEGDGRTYLLKEGFCGSQACALGHAALIPEFIEAGFKVSIEDRTGGVVVFKDEDGEEIRGAYAGAEFFDIPDVHSYHLFGGGWACYSPAISGEVSAQEVAAYLRKYVETDGQCLQTYINQY